jgi:hypothetical protein
VPKIAWLHSVLIARGGRSSSSLIANAVSIYNSPSILVTAVAPYGLPAWRRKPALVMAVSRVLAPFVARVIIANPLQVKAIAQAHVKTDKIDAGTLASLQAAGYLPQIWTPDAETERKNEVHSILHAHLIPKCPHADLFNARGRAWLAAQQLPDDDDRRRLGMDSLTTAFDEFLKAQTSSVGKPSMPLDSSVGTRPYHPGWTADQYQPKLTLG